MVEIVSRWDKAKLLFALAQAVGSESVKLTIDLDQVTGGTYLKTIPVAPLGGPAVGEAEGLLMPVNWPRERVCWWKLERAS